MIFHDRCVCALFYCGLTRDKERIWNEWLAVIINSEITKLSKRAEKSRAFAAHATLYRLRTCSENSCFAKKGFPRGRPFLLRYSVSSYSVPPCPNEFP